MEYVKLNNGMQMPVLGYGLYKVDPAEAKRCVADALEVGYRSIDTAQIYLNEEGVGAAIEESGIPRENIFLTTKVWINNAGYDAARTSIDRSLSKLRTGYADLILVHQPFGDYYGTWRALEEAVLEGKARAIGLSNFQAVRFMDFARNCRIAPAIDQLECNVYSQQEGIREFLSTYGTVLEAWGPLGQGRGEMLVHPAVRSIASATGKTPAQVCLRYLIQRGVVVIPKSTHKERMKENLDVFDFSLSDSDMANLATLNQSDRGTRNYEDPVYAGRLIDSKA